MYKKMAISMIMAIFFIVLDLFLKFYALHLLPSEGIRLVSDIFQLKLAKNTGIAFSIPFSGPILNIFISLVIMLLVFFFIKELKEKKERFILPLTFIIIGALINLSDRLRYGFVIDYFDLKWFTIFNIADCMIFFSAVYVLFKTQKRKLDE